MNLGRKVKSWEEWLTMLFTAWILSQFRRGFGDGFEEVTGRVNMYGLRQNQFRMGPGKY